MLGNGEYSKDTESKKNKLAREIILTYPRKKIVGLRHWRATYVRKELERLDQELRVDVGHIIWSYSRDGQRGPVF